MPRLTLCLLAFSLLGACASPDPSNQAAYCTPENAFRLGTQSRAYMGVCPKSTESAFLSSLRRGRALQPAPPQVLPYYSRMEQLENQLVASGSDTERNQLRASLSEVEWWTIHIINSPATYGVGQ